MAGAPSRTAAPAPRLADRKHLIPEDDPVFPIRSIWQGIRIKKIYADED
jgi:hypothetical protein